MLLRSVAINSFVPVQYLLPSSMLGCAPQATSTFGSPYDVPSSGYMALSYMKYICSARSHGVPNVEQHVASAHSAAQSRCICTHMNQTAQIPHCELKQAQVHATCCSLKDASWGALACTVQPVAESHAYSDIRMCDKTKAASGSLRGGFI